MTQPTEHLAAAIRHLAVPIDSVSPDPGNARKHSERNIQTVADSLRAYRQQTPIVVDCRGVIRKGSGTWLAAKRLEWPTIAAVTSDLADAELPGYAIADNRSGDEAVGSEWDEPALAATLEALRDDDALDGVGFTADEVAALIDEHRGEVPEFEPVGAGDQSRLDQKAAVCCPNCGTEFVPS